MSGASNTPYTLLPNGVAPSVIALGDFKGQFVPIFKTYLEYIEISPYLLSKCFNCAGRQVSVESFLSDDSFNETPSVERFFQRTPSVGRFFQPLIRGRCRQVPPRDAVHPASTTSCSTTPPRAPRDPTRHQTLNSVVTIA